MSNILLKTKGTKGWLMVYEDRVAIEIHGAGGERSNSLPYSQITGVELKSVYAGLPFLVDAKSNIKIFSTGQQLLQTNWIKTKDAKNAKELIEARIGNVTSPASSGIDDLEKLSELKDKKIITQQEFEQKKKQLLGL